ncbi:MAG TPA: hypothetical protein VK906_16485 [Egicoccus sp.]|nr:hypothetical protein [Egicoccus sp.]HSK24785.1 hypothetical protein [Egicoccus sp.]
MSAGDAKDRVKQQVQDAVAKAQREFEAAKAEARTVQAKAQTPPAKDADEAAQQARDLRARLDQDIAALEARIPPRDTMLGQARAVGGAVVGGLGLLGVVATLRGKRKEKQEFEAEADKVARAIARHLPAALADLSPPAVPVDDDEDDDGEGHSAVRVVAVLALLASAAYAVWTQMRDRAAEPDIWGPPGDMPPPTAAAPADASVPGAPPTPSAAPGAMPTSPASDDEDLFGNRPKAP